MGKEFDLNSKNDKLIRLFIDFIELIETSELPYMHTPIAEEVIFNLTKSQFKTQEVSHYQIDKVVDEVSWKLELFLKSIKLNKENRYLQKKGFKSSIKELYAILHLEIDTTDVGHIIGVSRQHAATLAKKGMLVKIPSENKVIFFYLKDILFFLENNKKYPKKYEELIEKMEMGFNSFKQHLLENKQKVKLKPRFFD